MGYENVFNCLREIFPESLVNHGVLRVVALENPNNVDAAVDYVLTEIIPRFRDDISSSSASRDPRVAVSTSNVEEHAVENETKIQSLRHEQIDTDSSESDTTDSEASQESRVNNFIASVDYEQSLEDTETTSFTLPASMHEDGGEVGLNHVAPGTSNGLVYCEICQRVNPVTKDIKWYRTLIDGVGRSSSDWHSHFDLDWHSPFRRDLNRRPLQELYDTNLNYESFPANEDSDSQVGNLSIGNTSSVQSDYEKSNANGTPSLGFKQECSTGEMSVIEDGLMGNGIITQSGQPCDIDLLDEIIEDAKEYKTTLFSVMESVINEMKELEDKEKYVEKVKEETANGEAEILAKVEEMKQTVAHSMEANDMHAGEVYGEKAVLGTETRELQSRLIGLSNERDESLSILDEMHTTLQARIAAVDPMLKAAVEEKLVKEEQARNALAEQEDRIERVAQESTILRQEAEENSKLREFLTHRGQLVDVLQGEISVICQDVRLLKEKFDLEVPLSKSISSSQTSCILASLGSSYKRAASDEARFCLPLKDFVPFNLDAKKGVASNSRIEGSRASTMSSSSLSSNYHEEERGRSHFKALSDDDGWEIFDKDAELAEALDFVDAKESLREL